MINHHVNNWAITTESIDNNVTGTTWGFYAIGSSAYARYVYILSIGI